MAMAPRNDVLVRAARLIRAAVVAEDDPAPALAAVCAATCLTGVRAAGAVPPVGGGHAWLLRQPLIVPCFLGGVGAMWASVWVTVDADRRRATGHILLAMAVANLLVTMALTGIDPHFPLNIIDDML